MGRPDPADPHAWLAPGPVSVADGIYRLPLPLPHDALKAVNAYLVVGDDEIVLIDPGWDVPEARAELERSLAVLGLRVQDLTTMYVTHMHRDHYTLGVGLAQAYGIELLLGVGEQESVEMLLRGESASTEPWLEPWGAEALRADLGAVLEAPGIGYGPPTRWLTDDVDIAIGGRTLRAIGTPGHTRGHVVFADLDAGLLFSGDHVLPSITPTVGYETVRAINPLGDFLASLEAMKDLPELALMPAHGRTGTSSHERATELLDHHARRLGEISAELREPVSAYEVAQRLPWRTLRVPFSTLAIGDRMLAVGETAAHLDYLAERGSATRTEATGTRRYALVQ